LTRAGERPAFLERLREMNTIRDRLDELLRKIPSILQSFMVRDESGRRFFVHIRHRPVRGAVPAPAPWGGCACGLLVHVYLGLIDREYLEDVRSLIKDMQVGFSKLCLLDRRETNEFIEIDGERIHLHSVCHGALRNFFHGDDEFLYEFLRSQIGGVISYYAATPANTLNTAHCLYALIKYGEPKESRFVRYAINFLRNQQEDAGYWPFIKYATREDLPVYNTCIAIRALLAAGVPPDDDMIRRGIRWLLRAKKNGGWGPRAEAARPEIYTTAHGIVTLKEYHDALTDDREKDEIMRHIREAVETLKNLLRESGVTSGTLREEEKIAKEMRRFYPLSQMYPKITTRGISIFETRHHQVAWALYALIVGGEDPTDFIVSSLAKALLDDEEFFVNEAPLYFIHDLVLALTAYRDAMDRKMKEVGRNWPEIVFSLHEEKEKLNEELKKKEEEIEKLREENKELQKKVHREYAKAGLVAVVLIGILIIMVWAITTTYPHPIAQILIGIIGFYLSMLVIAARNMFVCIMRPKPREGEH